MTEYSVHIFLSIYLSVYLRTQVTWGTDERRKNVQASRRYFPRSRTAAEAIWGHIYKLSTYEINQFFSLNTSSSSFLNRAFLLNRRIYYYYYNYYYYYMPPLYDVRSIRDRYTLMSMTTRKSEIKFANLEPSANQLYPVQSLDRKDWAQVNTTMIPLCKF